AVSRSMRKCRNTTCLNGYCGPSTAWRSAAPWVAWASSTAAAALQDGRLAVDRPAGLDDRRVERGNAPHDARVEPRKLRRGLVADDEALRRGGLGRGGRAGHAEADHDGENAEASGEEPHRPGHRRPSLERAP